jgi:hypothetical protein
LEAAGKDWTAAALRQGKIFLRLEGRTLPGAARYRRRSNVTGITA